MAGPNKGARRAQHLAPPLSGGLLQERCYCHRMSLPHIHTLKECLRERTREQALRDFAEKERVR